MGNIKKNTCTFIATTILLYSSMAVAQDINKKNDISKDLDVLEQQIDNQLSEKNELGSRKIVSTSPTPVQSDNTESAQETIESPIKSDVKNTATSATPSTLTVPKGFEDQFEKFNIEDTKEILNKSKEDAPFSLQESDQVTNKNSNQSAQPILKPATSTGKIPTVEKTQPTQVKPNLETLKDEMFSPYIDERKIYDYRNQTLSSQISKDAYGPNNSHLPRTFYIKEYTQYLFIAAVNDDINSIRTFLERGADINAKDAKNGYTPLMYSVLYNKQQAYNYLISKGANVNIKSNDGKTALHIAAMVNNLDAMESLLDQGADPNKKDTNGRLPYSYTSSYNKEFALLAVKNSSDMNKALIDSAELEEIQAVKYALKNGAHVDYQSENGDTALIIATRKGNSLLVNFLFSEGANPFIRNKQGLSALDIAALNNDQKLKDNIKTVIVMNELDGKVEPPYAQEGCENYLGYDLSKYPTIKFLHAPLVNSSISSDENTAFIDNKSEKIEEHYLSAEPIGHSKDNSNFLLPH
jgi:ankyrin repeat protein